MGFSSQTGALGIGEQTAKGAIATADAWVKVLTGAMGITRELIVPDPEIGGNRDIDEDTIYPGSVGAAGTYEFIFRPDSLGHFIKGALGDCDSTALSGVSGAYQHTFTPADTLPWYTILERLSNTYEAFTVTDCKFNSLDFNCKANDYLRGTAEILGNIPVSDATVTGETYEDTHPFLYAGATIKFGNDTILPIDVSFSLKNNMEDSDYRVGTIYRTDLIEKRRELVLGATIRPDDSDLLKQAIWGDKTKSSPQNTKTNISVNYKWITYEKISGNTPYSLEIDVPVAVIAPFKVDPKGADAVEHALEIRAAKGAEDLVTITLVNTKDAYTS
jgi:hypothetical protein